MSNTQLISAKVKSFVNIYMKKLLENFDFIWLLCIYPSRMYLLVWFITVWNIIHSNMQHYKIQQYSFKKNPLLMITQLCSNILVALIFFTVVWNYSIGWCDMVFNIDSNKRCTYFHRNMNIHCVLHIETFWFPCSSALGQGEQPQNRGAVIPVWKDEMVLWHYLYSHICQTSKLNPTASLFSSLRIVMIFVRNWATPLPPPCPKKVFQWPIFLTSEKCTFGDKNCYKWITFTGSPTFIKPQVKACKHSIQGSP
jgi:hypothetical protein